MEWSLSPVFGSYAIVGLIAAGLFFVWFVMTDSQGLSLWQRTVLRALRLLMILVLLLAILKPGMSWTKQREPSGTVAVLMDKSSSMQLGSGEGPKSRWDQQLELWNTLWSNRDQLGKQVKLSPFLYDSQLQPLGEFDLGEQSKPPVLPQRAEGVSTDIGGPLGGVANGTYSIESGSAASSKAVRKTGHPDLFRWDWTTRG
jgi:hypothetical protein